MSLNLGRYFYQKKVLGAVAVVLAKMWYFKKSWWCTSTSTLISRQLKDGRLDIAWIPWKTWKRKVGGCHIHRRRRILVPFTIVSKKTAPDGAELSGVTRGAARDWKNDIFQQQLRRWYFEISLCLLESQPDKLFQHWSGASQPASQSGHIKARNEPESNQTAHQKAGGLHNAIVQILHSTRWHTRLWKIQIRVTKDWWDRVHLNLLLWAERATLTSRPFCKVNMQSFSIAFWHIDPPYGFLNACWSWW